MSSSRQDLHWFFWEPGSVTKLESLLPPFLFSSCLIQLCLLYVIGPKPPSCYWHLTSDNHTLCGFIIVVGCMRSCLLPVRIHAHIYINKYFMQCLIILCQESPFLISGLIYCLQHIASPEYFLNKPCR